MQGIIKSKGRLLSILVFSLLCSKKFYGILSCISKNVIELYHCQGWPEITFAARG